MSASDYAHMGYALCLFGLYAILVGIPLFVFNEPLPGDTGGIHHHNGMAGNLDVEKRAGRRLRRERTEGRTAARGGGAARLRPRSKIIPPCNMVAGRRMRWRSGRRGLGGRPRRNAALDCERWTIVRYGASRADEDLSDERGPCVEEDAMPKELVGADEGRHGCACGNVCDGPRRDRNRRRLAGPTPRCSRLLRAAMTLALCVAAGATDGRTGRCGGPAANGPPRDLAPRVDIGGQGADPDVVAWIAKPSAPSVIKYPPPDQTGFHGARSAGHEAAAGEPGGDKFAMSAVTINSSGWGPLKEFLTRTDAHIVFGQEHRLPSHDIPAASAWARRHGWKSVWAPATKGARGGWSAGTVIMARSFIGLRHPDVGGRVVAEARAVAAIVEAPSFRPFMAYCAYGHDGQGLSKANLTLCADVGQHWEAQGDPALQFLVAADRNLEPHDLGRAGLTEAMDAKLVCPATVRGTCRTRSRSSIHDYFVMSKPMSGVIDRIHVLEATGVRTHTPVELVFLPRPTSLRALSFRRPPQFPVERVFGPLLAPPSWELALSAADGLCKAIRGGAKEETAERALTDLYAVWLDLAEQELIDLTGTRIGKEGLRGGGPRLVWRSVLPEKKTRDGCWCFCVGCVGMGGRHAQGPLTGCRGQR